MSDLLATVAHPALTPGFVPRTAPVALPEAVDFAAAMAGLLRAAAVHADGSPRQGIAADGKDLPVADVEEDDPTALIAWLPDGSMPLPEVTPAPGLAIRTAGPAAQLLLPTAAPLLTPLPPGPDGIALPPGATPVPGIHVPLTEGDAPPATPEMAGEAVMADAVEQLDASIVASDGPDEVSKPRSTASATLSPSPPLPTQPGTVASPPAVTMLAGALAAANVEPFSPATPRATDASVIQGQAAVAVEQARTSVQAMSATDQAPLDLTREDWTGRMIDRIAVMRDAVDAADTRIRLAPEHLGQVEVSIRRDGDRIHVHFTAENPATRQLLAEAAPRLSELAEARGLKLGQSSVDSGAGGQQGAPREQYSGQSSRPASALRSADAALTDTTDRIA